jgi:hypothetical protein
MSFLTGTQTELLYSMPASASAMATATAGGQIMSMNASTAGQQPFQLPLNFFPNTYGVGKTIILEGGGWYTTSSTANTLILSFYLDSTISTKGTVLASTGGTIATPTGGPTLNVSTTDGGWYFRIMATCTAIGAGTSATLNASGFAMFGLANNGAAPVQSAYAATAGMTVMMGTPQTGVVFNNATPYWLELWGAWSATTGSPTITMTNFLVWGCN